MALKYTIPKGPLVSFGPSITFVAGHSILHSDWSEEVTEEMLGLVSSSFEVDLAGFADLAIHCTYTWEYLISAPIGGSLSTVQDELTALITARRTQNSDGTTGQVGLLTVALLGYGGTNATAMARLVSVRSLESGQTYEKVLLGFTCPQGFSYTA
jgi:hypothetical protein